MLSGRTLCGNLYGKMLPYYLMVDTNGQFNINKRNREKSTLTNVCQTSGIFGTELDLNMEQIVHPQYSRHWFARWLHALAFHVIQAVTNSIDHDYDATIKFHAGVSLSPQLAHQLRFFIGFHISDSERKHSVRIAQYSSCYVLTLVPSATKWQSTVAMDWSEPIGNQLVSKIPSICSSRRKYNLDASECIRYAYVTWICNLSMQIECKSNCNNKC